MAVSVRTQVDDIKGIIDTDLTDNNIGQYQLTAATLMDQVGMNAADIAEGALSEIEKYLAAHFIASTKERQTSEEDAGTASLKYTGKYGMDLLSTSYGQMATILDVQGLLKKAGKREINIIAINQVDNE